MRSEFSPDHPEYFADLPKNEKPHYLNDYVECPQCKGHGAWNTSKHLYMTYRYLSNGEREGYYGYETRHCSNCIRGYVHPTQGDHIHKWAHHKNLGRCYNQYKCTECGQTQDVDSGD